MTFHWILNEQWTRINAAIRSSIVAPDINRRDVKRARVRSWDGRIIRTRWLIELTGFTRTVTLIRSIARKAKYSAMTNSYDCPSPPTPNKCYTEVMEITKWRGFSLRARNANIFASGQNIIEILTFNKRLQQRPTTRNSINIIIMALSCLAPLKRHYVCISTLFCHSMALFDYLIIIIIK